ncbi:MAG TPA: DUF2892 domain-containing protein [Solirubrobacterales bacterium]
MSTVATPRKDPPVTEVSPKDPVATEAPAEPRRRWPLERVLFLMAGTMTGLSAILAAVFSPWFLLLTGFVAINQLAFVALGNCPSSFLLRRYTGLRGAGER